MKQVEVKRRQIQLASYILGLIVLWVLGRNIGDNGIAYLVAALESFWIVWCITGSSIPDVLGKILRNKQSKEQYKDAHNMRRNIFLLQAVIGAVGSVLLFLGAGILTEKVFRMPYGKYILMLIAPVVFLKTVEAVLLGFFQGDGSELPTAASSVLRPILLLGFGLLFGKLLGGYGEKVSALLKVEAFESMYGGMGIALAFTVTELLMVLFLLLIYKGSRRSGQRNEEVGMKTTDGFMGHVRLLYAGMGGKILLHLLETLPLWMGLIFYQKSVADIHASASAYGSYVGEYLLLCGIMVLLIAVFQIGFQARTAYCVRKEDERRAKSVFYKGWKNTMQYSLYVAVFIGVMANQLAWVFGGEEAAVMYQMLQWGFAWIVFVSLAFYCSRTMLLLDKGHMVLLSVGIADVVFVVSTVLLLNVAHGDIMSLVIAGVIGAFFYAVILGVCMCTEFKYKKLEVINTMVMPAVSSVVVGALCYVFKIVFVPHLGAGVTLLVCLVLSALVYWGILGFYKKKKG